MHVAGVEAEGGVAIVPGGGGGGGAVGGEVPEISGAGGGPSGDGAVEGVGVAGRDEADGGNHVGVAEVGEDEGSVGTREGVHDLMQGGWGDVKEWVSDMDGIRAVGGDKAEGVAGEDPVSEDIAVGSGRGECGEVETGGCGGEHGGGLRGVPRF